LDYRNTCPMSIAGEAQEMCAMWRRKQGYIHEEGCILRGIHPWSRKMRCT
jgi:hypothetical protein